MIPQLQAKTVHVNGTDLAYVEQGTGDTVAKTLHRMDKTLVIKEATAAGFRLEKEGQMLSRPEDTRDFSVVKIRDKSDRFVLKFVKP